MSQARWLPNGRSAHHRRPSAEGSHVVHAVGPVWHGGVHGEDALLADCYRACFALAAEHGIRSIAFPAISTGVYRFPRGRACRIAVTETRSFTANSAAVERVVFCCFDAETLALYRAELGP